MVAIQPNTTVRSPHRRRNAYQESKRSEILLAVNAIQIFLCRHWLRLSFHSVRTFKAARAGLPCTLPPKSQGIAQSTPPFVRILYGDTWHLFSVQCIANALLDHYRNSLKQRRCLRASLDPHILIISRSNLCPSSLSTVHVAGLGDKLWEMFFLAFDKTILGNVR